MRASVALLIALALTACPRSAPLQPSSPVDVPLPALTLPRITGGTWSSTSARGSVLVIDVWASWCPPCSKGFPRLDALAKRRPDVVVVAISIDDDPEAVRDFIAKFPLAVPVAHDIDKQVTRDPIRVTALPAVLIVDGAGVIRHRLEKPSEHDYDHLEELVDRTAVRATSSP